MVKGHLQQQRKHQRSTRVMAVNHMAVHDPPPIQETTTNYIYVQPVTLTGSIHSDQTGQFPVQSSRGYKYIMVVYHYDSNAIIAEPLRSREGDELLRVYT